MFHPTKSDGQKLGNRRKKVENIKKKKKTFSHRLLILCQMKISFLFFNFVLFVLFLFESGTHMSPFAHLSPFQSRNNLFHSRFISIYLKWKFFNYFTFFGIFFKIFVLWGLIDVYRLEFRKNPTVSEFNEI